MAISICLVIIFILIVTSVYLIINLKKEKNNNINTKKMYHAIMDGYIAVVRIDIIHDTYEKIKVTQVVDNLLQRMNEQANFQMKKIMSYMVENGSVDELLDFVDLTTISERMIDKNRIFYDFHGRYNGWCRVEFLWEDKEKHIVIFTVKAIEEDKIKENKLRFLTLNDQLTELNNENYGSELVMKQIEERLNGMFCLIEVDNFKILNDQYGSQIGDKIIVEVASSIRECFKDEDIIFRRGGARFGVFSKDVVDKQDGRFIMKMLENSIEVINVIDDRITLSTGIAFYRMDENIAYDELLNRAESCLATSRAIDGVSVSYYD